MPSASRNERRKRRIRRNLTLYRRAATSEALARAKTAVAFFAVLSKLGGEIEVRKQDFDQAVANLTKLNFAIEPSAVEGYFMVKLVTIDEQEADTITPAEQPIEETADIVPAAVTGEASEA